MKVKKLLILALALSLPACSLLAQNDTPPQGGPPRGENGGPPEGGPGHGPGRRHHPPMPLVEAIDANHDGVISADEIANAPAALKTLDKNGDGQLTMDELMPSPPSQDKADGDKNGPPPANGMKPGGPGGHRPPPMPLFEALDTNHDGVISADEIANAPAALRTLDKNGDGQLTRDEVRPQRPPPPQDGNDSDGPGNGQRPPPPQINQ